MLLTTTHIVLLGLGLAACSFGQIGDFPLSGDFQTNPMKPTGSGPFFKVERGKKWGFIDAHGRMVIAPRFDSVGDFFEGLAPFKQAGKSGFLDEHGHVEFWLPENVPQVGSFSEGLAPFRVGATWGYIDKTGRVAIPPQFYDANPFCDGLARVWVLAKEKRFGYIDHAGNFAIPPRFWIAYDFSNGLAMVREPGEKRLGFIDRRGKFVIPPQFEFAESFSGGLARVVLSGKNGTAFVDRSGKCVLFLKGRDAQPFVEGVTASCTMTVDKSRPSGLAFSCGFMDKTGKFVIASQRGRATNFSDGLALIRNDDISYYIDHTGKTVLTVPQGRGTWPFVDGLTIVESPEGPVYVDKTGRKVAAY